MGATAAPFCRDCLTTAPANAKRCPACGSPRLLVHPERDELSIAHIDCDAFYAAVEKRDRPELADAVDRGDLSANAAAIQAGFRRRTVTIPTEPREALVAALRRHFPRDVLIEAAVGPLVGPTKGWSHRRWDWLSDIARGLQRIEPRHRGRFIGDAPRSCPLLWEAEAGDEARVPGVYSGGESPCSK